MTHDVLKDAMELDARHPRASRTDKSHPPSAAAQAARIRALKLSQWSGKVRRSSSHATFVEYVRKDRESQPSITDAGYTRDEAWERFQLWTSESGSQTPRSGG